MPVEQSLAALEREIGESAERLMLRREGVSDYAVYRLRCELDMLAHQMYLRRNAKLFRLVDDALAFNIFGERRGS